jgi:cation diffusion facilitator family transporter
MQDIFKKGQKTTMIAALSMIFFAAAKAAAGFLSGSVVLLADAVHSAADSLATLLAWVGLKIAQKSPTKKFPYGYYKAENITALLISVLIFFAGYEIVKESYQKIFVSSEISFAWVAMAVALLDAVVMSVIGTYEMKVGQEIGSQSMIADGKESRMHIFSSSLVLAGLVSNQLNIPYIEGAAGIFISLFVFQAGFESLRDSIFALMDVSPSPEVEGHIKNILKSNSDIQGFEGLKLRKSGPFIFGEVNIKVKKFVEVEKAHEIAGRTEKKMKAEIPQLDSFTIHTEPFKKEKQIVIVPVETKRDLDSVIDVYFARTSFFAVLALKNKKIQSFKFKPNPFKQKQIRAGLNVANHILKEKPDAVIAQEIGPIALHALRDNLVEVYQTEKATIREVIANWAENKLVKLTKPTRKKQ